MNETNPESSTTESVVNMPETSVLPSSSSSSMNTIDEETKRRKIMSKLWGKGSKSSHKIRELEKSTTSNGHDSLIDNSNNLSLYSSNDGKLSIDDNSNSINSKPLAVVKPIVMVKSGIIISSATDRIRVNSEASSSTTNITQIDETTTIMSTTERQPSSTATTNTNETSSKKKKSHKNEESKKKKAKNKSKERDRSKDRHHHREDEQTNTKKNSSSSKDHHGFFRHHSSSTTSLPSNRRRSPSNSDNHSDRRSNRTTTSKKDDPSVNRHHRRSSRTRSPSPERSRHSKKHHSSTPPPKKENQSSTLTTKSDRSETEFIPNSKSTLSNSHKKDADTIADNVIHRQKSQTNDENSLKQRKHQESSLNTKSEKPKTTTTTTTTTNRDETCSDRRKASSSLSRHDQRRSHSRHRSKSKEEKTNRKAIDSSRFEDNSNHGNRTNQEKESTTGHENSHHDKKSSRESSIPSIHDDHRRKSSYDYHRYDRHHSPSEYDRRHDYDYHHGHSHRSNTHYVHHHHHHHYRSPSPRYHHHHHHRRSSSSPRSRQRHSRYFSSTSSSFSPSPRRRSPSSRTSSSSSRTSSSYSSISRISSSRSSSRNRHYYHHHDNKKCRRSPTLEKLFLKASESIEAVSTQRNPNASSSLTNNIPTHIIPFSTSSTNLNAINALSGTNPFYSEQFSGFSVPPPPFIPQQHQRYLKEITTDSSTARRIISNEIPPITSSIADEVTSNRTNPPSADLSTNDKTQSVTTKPPRVSRFSDIIPSVTAQSVLNTNLPVETPLNYTQISDNINCLPSSRRQQKRHNREVMECECTTSEYDRSRGIKACGSECLNRMLLIECSSNCPCGQWCTNRRFQKRSYASHRLALFKTEMKGYGLRTISSIRKSRFLVEYIGEVIDMDELTRRSKKYKRDGNIHQYVMSLIHGTVIDSTIKGNWARFINHSCEPNCVAEKWLVNGEYRMGIFAKRDLDSNEEITIDYRFETFGSADLANEKCYCAAPTCRGTISIRTNNNNNKSDKRPNRRQAIDDDELIEYLRDEQTNEYVIPRTIEEIRQLIQIMSRTDSENVRTMELDLIRYSSQKHFELPRLFLECNGLHVLCSWMKDILINHDDEQQQQDYSIEFQLNLVDFIQNILPIKDRTIVKKNGLLDLIEKNINLLTKQTTTQTYANDQQQIQSLIHDLLNHLDNPLIIKLCHLYSHWMSFKERYIIPKRKESEQTSIHHHHHHRHHHHHTSKHTNEETTSRLSFTTRPAMTQLKTIERYSSRRTYANRDPQRAYEQELSRDERRKLFEQEYEDAEKARVAAAAAANGESPGGQNEPPQKKQRTSDGSDPTASNTPLQSQTPSIPIDQTYCIHQYLSQIPIEYIRSYMTSIGQPISQPNATTSTKDEAPVPPPPRTDDEKVLSRIIHLPSGWSVAMCPSDSSVYFYNQQTMTSSWIPPPSTDHPNVPLDLSPLSSAQITEQRRPHHHHHLQQLPSSSRSALKLAKFPHRHVRIHRHHHNHHHISSTMKRKRPPELEQMSVVKEEAHQQLPEEIPTRNLDEQIEQEEIDETNPTENLNDSLNTHPYDIEMSTTRKNSSEIDENIENPTKSSSSFKINRDLLRKNISQHVHITLKPYTKRTCKQGRISTTDDIKYLVKKFTLAVLDKEIEKAKHDGISLSPILTDRVRLKTELYVKKYMNKMGPVFQRHGPTVHSSSSSQPVLPPTSEQLTDTTSNPE